MHNSEEATLFHKRAEEIRSREAETNNNVIIDGRATDAAVISITEDGTIDSVNKALCAMLGYARHELVGRNIKVIVPSPYKEKHDFFLDRYSTTGDAKVIGKPPRAVFAQHKLGHAFAINLSVQERRKENGDRSFVALLVQTDQDKTEGTIMIKEDGTIVLVSKALCDMFLYKPSELLRTVNLPIFIFLERHDSYA